MISNTTANITVNVGTPSNQTTLLSVQIYNDHGRTAQLSQEINGSTGITPNCNQVWVFSEGQSSEALKEKIEEIGFFGAPETYGSGSGAWANIDLATLREQGISIPSLSELPIANQSLPGNSHIEFDLSSSLSFQEAHQKSESEGYPPVVAFFNSLSLHLNVHGASETVEAALQTLEPIIGASTAKNIKTLTAAMTDAQINLSFASLDELPEDACKSLKNSSTLKSLIKEEVAGILAGIGDIFEQNFRLILVVSESIVVEVTVKAPGLVEWAMSTMDD